VFNILWCIFTILVVTTFEKHDYRTAQSAKPILCSHYNGTICSSIWSCSYAFRWEPVQISAVNVLFFPLSKKLLKCVLGEIITSKDILHIIGN